MIVLKEAERCLLAGTNYRPATRRATRLCPQLKRDAFDRRLKPGAAIVIGRSIVLESSQSAAALADTLRRAAAYGETRRVPDQLRAEDVDALYFALRPNGGFRIVPEGLRNALWRPRITVEGRGRIVSSPSQAQPRIYFEVGLDTPSVVVFALNTITPFGLAFYNLLADPPSLASFSLLCGLGVFMVALLFLHGRALVSRAWSGLLVEVQRLADGSLYVPAT